MTSPAEIPATRLFRAVQYDHEGDVDVLEIKLLPDLDLSVGQVRVSCVSAGINPFDAKMRRGLIPMPLPFPRCVGNDFAGRVIEVSAGAKYFDGSEITVGDEVLGFVNQDALREHIIVDSFAIARKPHGITWEQAGSLATPGLTAEACIELLKPGVDDTVLVSAAAGAVGAAFSQMAVKRGARVLGIASHGNSEYLRSLGVFPVDYAQELIPQIHHLAPAGVTLAQDNFGREYINLAMELGLSPQNICSIVDHAATAELGLAQLGKYERKAQILEKLALDVAHGELIYPISGSYRLEQVQEAFTHLEQGHGSGKTVITI